MSHSKTVHRENGIVYTFQKSDTSKPRPPPCHTGDGCQACLLKEIIKLLEKLAAESVPYHSGPTAVSLPSPTPLPPDSDSKAPQGDGKDSEVPEPLE